VTYSDIESSPQKEPDNYGNVVECERYEQSPMKEVKFTIQIAAIMVSSSVQATNGVN
jgi:hypothetical protein